jgi:Lrp/AsnC family leucine-responsive transcriptional regulator
MDNNLLQSEINVDEITWRILRELQQDSRLSYNALSRHIGMSTPAVVERVRRLEEDGTIIGYHTTVSRSQLGRPLSAFLRLSVSATSFQRVIALCGSLESVFECHHIAGEDCFLIKIAVASVMELEDVISRFRRFGTAQTSIVLSSPVSYKPISAPSR